MRRKLPPPKRVLTPFERLEADEPAFARWIENRRWEDIEYALQFVARAGRNYDEELAREGTGAHRARLSIREATLRRAIEEFNRANRNLFEMTREELERQRAWFQRDSEQDPSLLDPPKSWRDLLSGRKKVDPPESETEKNRVRSKGQVTAPALPQEDDFEERRRAAIAEARADPRSVADRFLTADQLEERWKLAHGTVERMVSYKEIPSARVSGESLVRLVDVEDLERRIKGDEMPPRFLASPGARRRGEAIRAAVMERAKTTDGT